MKFRLVSDLHLDFSSYTLPVMDDEINTILLLAGDICEGNNTHLLEKFLDNHTKRFKHILMILGNHDFYHQNLYTWPKELQNHIYRKYRNVSLLVNESRDVGENVVVIGSTLWTDFEKNNPNAHNIAQASMADYFCIQAYDGQRIVTNDVYAEHMRSKAFIRREIDKHKSAGKTVIVMTHHAPSWKSVGDKFIGDRLNGAFVSELDDMILDLDPYVWVHGHSHTYKDYLIGSTRVMCNPRGYRSRNDSSGEYTGFDSECMFEV